MEESRSYNAAVVGEVIEHEYGHRAHDAKGGWPGAEVGCNFCESVAEFIRVAKEDNAITRGQDAHYLPSPVALDSVRNNSPLPHWVAEYYQWAPGLYDLFDWWAEDIDPYRCSGELCPDIQEGSHLPFRNMWDVFENEILDTDPEDPATAGQRWTKIYVNANGLRPQIDPDYPCSPDDVWSYMRRTSVFHGVYTCDDTFPQAP